MKYARLGLDQGPRYAAYDEETGDYLVLNDDPLFHSPEPSGQIVTAEEARVVAPMIPRSKVVGFGGTYSEKTLDECAVFLKPNTSVIGPEDAIYRPDWIPALAYEAELAIIISRVCKAVPVARAHEVIFGYTLANDVSAVGMDGARAKAFDASCPLGPLVSTEKLPQEATLSLRINDELVGTQSLSALRFSPEEIVAYASTLFTLLPGDIILTGCAVGGGAVSESDVVRVELDSIGACVNRVIAGF